MGSTDDWPPEKRRLYAGSFWTRGLLHLHEEGPENFGRRWALVMNVASVSLALLTCAAVAWILPLPYLRFVIAVIALPTAYGLWFAVAMFTIMLLHGFRRVDMEDGSDGSELHD